MIEDEREKTEEELTQERIVKQHKKELESILSTIEGRSFLWRLIYASGVYAHSSPMSAEASNYLAGKRDVGLEIMRSINEVNPIALQTMNRENLEGRYGHIYI